MLSVAQTFIGTAGWSIAARYRQQFPATGSNLERYAARLGAAEINSSFYRPHRRETYARWAASVPHGFRFAVKVSKTITHDHRLIGCRALLDEFLGQAEGLGGKLGVLLVQLPPKLAFDRETATAFFTALRERTSVGAACEPRHASWFEPRADALMHAFHIARVVADPARCDGAIEPAGWPQLAYFRLHGSPDIYRSDYPPAAIEAWRQRMEESTAAEVWCIFDNTTASHALGNAMVMAGDQVTFSSRNGQPQATRP
jgi:uncharacterized protein YecE (DUF72 family)